MSLDQDFAEGWAAGPLKTLATDLSNSSLPSPSGRRRRLSSDGFDRGLSPLMWGPSDDDLSVFEVDDLSSVCDSGFCGSSCNNSSFNSNNTGVLSNASSLSSIYDAFRSEKELSRLVSSPPPVCSTLSFTCPHLVLRIRQFHQMNWPHKGLAARNGSGQVRSSFNFVRSDHGQSNLSLAPFSRKTRISVPHPSIEHSIS